MRKKITVVGAGNVGATVAHCCLRKDLGDVTLIDIAENVAKGKALDLTQASVLEGHSYKVNGTGDYKDTEGSDLVIVTAGMVRKPGMSRDDLLKTNIAIVKDVMKSAVAASPNALFIVVSNPVDVLCRTALEAGKLAPHRLIGLSGMLDGSRLRAFIAEKAGVPAGTVTGLTLGEHGDAMVPLPRLATIGGVPAPSILSADELEEVRVKTTHGGAGVVALLGYSAYYAPGIAVATMAEAMIKDSHAIVNCSAYCSGQYGANDIYMCVPARLGAKGVEEVVELDLDSTEKAALENSIASIKKNLDNAASLG